jgi:NADPH:quinone reductase-like Zn-dependent oxidoreductase
MRASGRHYSSAGGPPFIPGFDGTRVREDGECVYFAWPDYPFGAMAQMCVVDESHVIQIPEGLNNESAAAMAIPGMSSWAALNERAFLRAGETVLINGATGTSGRLAIQIAKHLGAKKVIATGRDAASFEALRLLGADVTIALTEDRDGMETAFKKEFEEGVDIVLDYLWGVSAETLLTSGAKAGPEGVPTRFVQIGSISGAEITLPASLLRSSALQLIGSGVGSVPFQKLLKSIQGVLAAAPSAGFKIATNAVPLSDVSRAWTAQGSDSRIVLIP